MVEINLKLADKICLYIFFDFYNAHTHVRTVKI